MVHWLGSTVYPTLGNYLTTAQLRNLMGQIDQREFAAWPQKSISFHLVRKKFWNNKPHRVGLLQYFLHLKKLL